MLGTSAAGSGKRYGRGGTATVVDNVFCQKPTADPYLFDSEESDGESKSKSKVPQPVAKKTRVKSSSQAAKPDTSASRVVDTKQWSTKFVSIEKTKSIKQPAPLTRETAKPQRKQDVGASNSTSTAIMSADLKKRNTRVNSSSSRTDSENSLKSMQITSTTVHQSEEVESDDENTEPSMVILSETVYTGEDDEFNSNYNGEFGARLRNRSISSQKSTSTTRSYRGKKSNGPQSTSSIDSHDSSVDNQFQARTESDRLKQFLQSGERMTRSRHSSVNSSDSYRSKGETKPVESCKPKKNIQSSSKQFTPSLRLQRLKTESDRIKQLLESGDSEPTNSSTSRNSLHNSFKGQESDRLKRFLESGGSSCSSASWNHLDSKSQESERLKQFLNSNSIAQEDSKSVSSLSRASSSNSLDETLVPDIAVRKESKRLKEFLKSSADGEDADDDSASNQSPSSPASPTPLMFEMKESTRLKEFLNSGDAGGGSSRESSPQLDAVGSKTKYTSSKTKPRSDHTGLSQAMDEFDLSPVKRSLGSTTSLASPPKRRIMADEFNFDSDNEGDFQPQARSSLNPVSSRTGPPGGKDETTTSMSNKSSKVEDGSKPVINFEKMEGRKERSASKPTRKLLRNPGKSEAKYRYNHRAWLEEEQVDEEELLSQPSSNQNKAERLKRPLELKKVVKYPDKLGQRISTQVKVRQDQKKLYTVVRNVRQAHECQDHGENQQIDDDLEFLLDGLEPREGTNSRYLSAVSLANKCTNATFRMYLRSQGSLTRIFTSLSDAPTDPRLALSATAIMYMLCQDRLNMDLDRASLQLMVELLEYDDRAHLEKKQEVDDYEKSINTVYSLYKSAIPAGEELLEKSDLSPGYLSMECLLVLTSRRSGDWFKEELREVGAIICIADNIIEKTVEVMTADYDMELSQHVLIILKKICRGLRVLEHVTAYNDANQRLIIHHKVGEFVVSLCRLLMFGSEAIATHCVEVTSSPSSAGPLILQLMLGALRVLVNVTHNSDTGCEVVSSFSGITDVLLKVILQSPQYVLDEQRFDLLVLGIGLSINMCENSASCRQTLLDSETLSSYDSICEQETVTSAEALLLLFNQRLRAAEKIEAETGRLQESDIVGAIEEDANESITEVLHKAGRHMEDTIVASYIALLVGVIVQHSPDYTDQIKEYLRENSFGEIISVLQKFLNFMKMADAASGNTGSKSIGTVIAYLRECA